MADRTVARVSFMIKGSKNKDILFASSEWSGQKRRAAYSWMPSLIESSSSSGIQVGKFTVRFFYQFFIKEVSDNIVYHKSIEQC